MMVAFTFIAAIGQTFMKSGAARLGDPLTLTGLLADSPLQIGLLFYCGGALLVVLALRHGELSVLYPVISLSYVWVAILAVVIFHESLTVTKTGGIAAIIAGVAILGGGKHK
jgi:drug/metabolite transporter (DMT)-like permease